MTIEPSRPNLVDAAKGAHYCYGVDERELRSLLEALSVGELSAENALQRLRRLPYADLGHTKVDHHRALRQGVPEVVLAEHKSVEQLEAIAKELIARGSRVLLTRLDADKADALATRVPQLRHNATARTMSHAVTPAEQLCTDHVNIITAGTSDLPVALEAQETLELCGVPSRLISDVGVAGIHRLLSFHDDLAEAPANIVIAGMEGALASVVGGLVKAPVVAVPTSVGYGAALSGFTALLGMLTSCASGVTVVNIDNGFGAAMAVVRILQAARERGS